MLCPRCSREIPDDAALCCYCGRVFVRSPSHRTRPNGAGYARKRGAGYQAEVVVCYEWDEERHKYKPKTATKGGFSTKKAALEYCAQLKQEAAAAMRGAPAPAPSEPRTVEYYWTLSKSQMEKAGVSKASKYQYAYNKMSAISHRLLSSLSVKELQEVVDANTSSFYPARDMKTVLSKLYELAMIDEECPVNKAKSITLPQLEEDVGEPWTMDEVKKQWEAFDAGDVFMGYVLLMDYTGMMPGELLQCKKSMIDFERRRIIGDGLKTDKRRESPIVFPDFITPVLLALCAESSGDKLATINKDNFYKTYHAHVVAAGCRDLPPYSCRHTAGTALAVGGNVAPAIIQKVMRHARFTSTERYIHPDFDDAQAAVDTLKKPD